MKLTSRLWHSVKKILKNLEEYLLISSLGLLVFLVFLQVVMRYFFQRSLTWSEEIARFLFLWMVWLGAALATKYDRHLKIELFLGKMSNSLRKKVDIVSMLIWISFSFFLFWKGAELTKVLIYRHQLSPVLEIPMACAYAAVPAGAGLMLLRLLVQLKQKLRYPEKVGK